MVVVYVVVGMVVVFVCDYCVWDWVLWVDVEVIGWVV